MALTLIFVPDTIYNREDILASVLYESGIDIFSKGFYIKKLCEGVYEINIPNEPKNWKDILKQYWEVKS
ncbi:MAG: hypothetical protein QXN71_01050 [Candidatus Aenigmatarchaeota archaeon]